MIWALRMVLLLLLRYPQWIGIIDFIITLGVMVMIALAIRKSIQDRKKGGIGDVGKKEKSSLN